MRDELGRADVAFERIAAVDGAAFDQPSVRERLLRIAFESTAQ